MDLLAEPGRAAAPARVPMMLTVRVVSIVLIVATVCWQTGVDQSDLSRKWSYGLRVLWYGVSVLKKVHVCALLRTMFVKRGKVNNDCARHTARGRSIREA